MSSTSTPTRNRHQAKVEIAGQKVGGRFKRYERTSVTAIDGHTSQARFDHQDMQETYAQIRRIVYSKQHFGNAEDIVQDSMMELWRWRERHDHEALSEHRGIIQQCVNRHISKYANQHERHENHSARRLLQQIAENEETQLGRPLTEREYEKLAHQVRESIQPKSRPKEDYWRGAQQTLSLEALTENNENDDGGTGTLNQHLLTADTNGTEAQELGNTLQLAASRIESQQTNIKTLQNDFWGTLTTEDPDTPPIRYMARSEAKQLHATLTPLSEEIEASNPTIQTSLNNLQKQENQRAIKRAETHVEKLVQQGKIPTNQKQAAIQHFTQKARKQVTIHDLPKEARLHPCPIHETANQYLDGHSTKQGRDVLFAPFGGEDMLTEEQQASVASRLANNKQFARKLWEMAVISSQNTKH